jgi:hypothetical protein
MTMCPRCGEPLATGQEYCLACGTRVGDGPTRAGAGAHTRWALRALATGVVALAGAAAAVAATGTGGDDPTLVTAIGGFATAPTSAPGEAPVGPSGVAEWPTDEDGWTIAIAALPQTSGRAVAVTRARTARRKGLPQVGVLDSSRYASLHPGYWIVFSGVYSTEAEATSALDDARRASRNAVVRHVVP